MHRFSVLKEVKGLKTVPFYFLYGEEDYLARLILEELKLRISAEGKCLVEKFELGSVSWPEVLDVARLSQGLFATWRLLILYGEYRSEEEGKEKKKPQSWSLSPTDKKAIRDYLASPNPQTILAVYISGDPKKIEGTSLSRFLKSFPEVKKAFIKLQAFPSEKKQWIRQEFRLRGKSIDEVALDRLMEMVGSDLGILHQEIEKIALFIGDKKLISIEDVNQITGWVAEADVWDLEEHLERGQVTGCIRVLDRLLAKGIKEEYILHQLAKSLNNIFLAKHLLQEGKSQREVFKLVKPYIKEYYSFYPRKFKSLFHAVHHLSFDALDEVLQNLKEVDLALKSTKLPPQVVFENFFFKYGQIMGKC